MAADLVRHALACHASNKPIRREGIREQIISGSNVRAMKSIFDRANEMLAQDFGLTMIPLPSHEKTLMYGANSNDPAQESQHIGPAKTSAPVNRWVLQSVLPDSMRRDLELEQSDNEKAILGFAATVLSLIFVSNMSVSMDQLIMYVRKLGPPECIRTTESTRESLAAGSLSDAQMESTAREAVNYLVRQGYLDKVAASAASGSRGETQSTQLATQQASNDIAESDIGMEYTWGPLPRPSSSPLIWLASSLQ
ncbi:MAGE family-domain-containing protein [Kickxella alabastrina]|uniref:MAGE family-domain-containing protein n=1 Tax=Kickxella alabastrina TaxID=61397 RepID=UPI0022211454|nr:MAGE family-domain-containing protein [Kickxella alabastrina]KAI7827798.1 MAGE family-domain-containing protein [Kickxella alabastrina]